MSKERCRDLIDKRVRLVKNVTTRGKTVFESGSVFFIQSAWRGLYTLRISRYGSDIVIRHTRRSNFEVMCQDAEHDLNRHSECPTCGFKVGVKGFEKESANLRQRLSTKHNAAKD